MSYYGSFSSSAFARDEPFDARRTIAPAEPYGSTRYATTDSTWALNQTANIWSTTPQQNRYDQPSYGQPQQQQYAPPSYGQPRYGQIFDQPLSGRPLNPMAAATDVFPRYSYMSGSGGGDSYGVSSYNSGRNDRYDDRRGSGRDYGRDGGRDNYRGDNRNGGGNRNYNNSRGGGGQRGDGRRRNDDNGPRRVNEFSSPKQSKQKKDYGPSRIAPADGNRERREQPRDGKRPFNKEGDGGRRNDRGGKPMRRRNNKSTDLEFVKIPDDVDSKSFDISEDNLLCFSGLQSVLATQHEFPIVIDGSVYSSVDHYYQIRKCKQLVGKNCEPLVATVQDEDKYKVEEKKGSGGNSYGQLAREFLKENKIDRAKVEEWRREGGVFATYDAMRAKVQQCTEMRDMLKDAADKIIVHTYAGDAIFGSGTRVQFVRKWAEELAKSGGKLAISLAPLVDADAISMAPQIAQGRNILGLIHMQLAEEIAQGGLPLVVTAASLLISTDKLDLSTVDISQEDEDELMKDE